jgi:hypothetical protein
MSHDWVYVRLPASHLNRAHAEKAYAIRLAEGALSTAEESDCVERIYFPHLVGDDIWCVLCPEKLQTDPHGNGAGDNLIGFAMVGCHVLNDEIDTGYGRPHYLEPSRVQRVSAFLAGVSLDDFRLKTKALLATGHRLWADPGMLDECYTRLRTFYTMAAERQQMVIVTPI